MKILFSPSEAKFKDGCTDSFNKNSFIFPELFEYRLEIINKFNVSPNCFLPKPKVDSTVLYRVPKNKIVYKIKNIEDLEKITSIVFSNKRKMINKNIKKIFKDLKYLNSKINLDLELRPSDLQLEKYYQITELYEKV